MTTGRDAEQGFTLVEMIVALLIFAILAGAGVGLLRASVDTQQVVEEELADLGTAARLRALIATDLAQAVIRPLEGAPTGFAGEGGRLTLVRAYDPADRVPGATGLQAVRWRLEGSSLVRQSIGTGGAPAGPAAVLADDVTGFALRYRAPDGNWTASWPSAAAGPVLPTAVELELRRSREAAVTLVVALPQGPAPLPPSATGGPP